MTRRVEGEFMKVNAWTFNNVYAAVGDKDGQGWTRMDKDGWLLNS